MGTLPWTVVKQNLGKVRLGDLYDPFPALRSFNSKFIILTNGSVRSTLPPESRKKKIIMVNKV